MARATETVHEDPAQARSRTPPRSPERATTVRVQRKLVVGATSDPYEREADRVAGAVVERLGRGAASSAVPQVARQLDPGAGGADGGVVRADTERRIARMRGGGGNTLDDHTRNTMESAIGADLGSVRVHTGRESSALGDELGARAFTVGSDVFVRREHDVRDTELMAHELAHVVQQGGTVRRDPSDTAAPPSVNVALQMSICSSMLVPMQNHVNTAVSLLMNMMPVAAQAIVQPQLFGALVGMAQPVIGMLNVAKSQRAAASQAWKPLKPLFSGTPYATMADQFDRGLTDLEWKFDQWIAMTASIGPGGMATIAQLTAMMQSDTSFVVTTSAVVLRPSALTPVGAPASPPSGRAPAAAPPAAPAAAPPQPVVAQPAPPVAPPQPVVAPPEPAVAQPAAPAAASGSGYDAYIVGPSADANADIDFDDDDVVEDIVLPKYDQLKQIDPHYKAESLSGSPDLPAILDAGRKLVAAGKVPDMRTYMMKYFGWSAEDVEKYVDRGEASKVAYLDAEQRKAFVLHGGSTLTQGTATDPFDTGKMFSKHSGNGFGIYVMAADGTIYADQHKVSLFHHSSFLAGGDVAAAGEIKVTAGKVKVVTNKTGHYKAGDPQLWQILEELRSRGVSLRGIELRRVLANDGWKGDAQDFWEQKKP